MSKPTNTLQPLRLAVLRRYPYFSAIHTVEITNGSSIGCSISEFGSVFACDAALISDDVEFNPKDIKQFMWVHIESNCRKLSFQKGFTRRKDAIEAAQDRAVLVKAIYDPYFIERHTRPTASPSAFGGAA